MKDAKTAEHLSKSGDVIVSPYMWSYCEEKDYSFSLMEDQQHVKVTLCVMCVKKQSPLSDLNLPIHSSPPLKMANNGSAKILNCQNS
mgnify:FL=1